MSWDYAVVRKRHERTGEYFYAVHEVFMDEEGRIFAATEEPITPMGDSLLALAKELAGHVAAVAVCDEGEVVDFDAIPEPGAVNPADGAGKAGFVFYEEVRDEWLKATRDVNCGHCCHWQKRSPNTGFCMARWLGVRDSGFEQARRYAKTGRGDWCARFEER